MCVVPRILSFRAWGTRFFAHCGMTSLSISPIIKGSLLAPSRGEDRAVDACFSIERERRKNIPADNAARIANCRSFHSPSGYEEQVKHDVGDRTCPQCGGSLCLMAGHDQQESVETH